MDVRSLAVQACAAFAVAAAAACGDSSTASTPPTPLTVWVLDDRAFVGDVERPIPLASVYFDPPGGGARVERTTDTEGRVVFEGDFTLGGGAVSAISNEHALLTKLDVRPDTIAARPNRSGKPGGDLVIVLPRFDAAQIGTMTLRGKITGKKDPASALDLSVSRQRRRGSTVTTEATYALSAPSTGPFFLIGHESKKVTNTFALVTNDLLGSFRVDSGGGANGTLDIDVATAAPLARRTTKVRLSIPRDPGSPFGDDSRGSAIVTSLDSQLLLGAIGKVARTSDGSAFEVEMGVVDVDIAPERPVTRAVITAADGSRSVRVEQGVAADGATIAEFLAPPTVVEASRSLADPLPLAGVPRGLDVRVDVVAGGQLVWVLESPPGGLREDTLNLPAALGLFALPTDVQVFGVTLTALADRVSLEPHGELYRRSSVSREILVRRR